MKRRILLLLLLLSAGAYSQEYAKYRNSKSDIQAAKSPKNSNNIKKESVKEAQTVEAVAEPVPSKRKGDFQATMDRALVQSKAGNYKRAAEIYTEAQGIGTEDQIWRAVVSRASTYSRMEEYAKAYADYTWMIEDKLTPKKKKAYAYYMRAVVASKTKTTDDDAQACDDLKKAKETGFPIAGKLNFDCK